MIGHLIPALLSQSHFLPSKLPHPAHEPEPPLSPIHRWTSSTQILVLKLLEGTIDFNMCNLLSSACAIALQNVGCNVPTFIQYGNNSRPLYQGISIDKFESNPERRFKMTFLNLIPPPFGMLNSLVEIFKARYNLRCISPDSSLVANQYRGLFVSIVARYDKILKIPWNATSELVTNSSSKLQYGQLSDPISKISLETHYPLSHVENFIDMTIDPVLAPQWNLILTFKFEDIKMNFSRICKRVIRDWDVLGTFNPFLDPSGPEPTLPGAFKSDYAVSKSAQSHEAGILNYLVDGHDLDDAIVSLFTTAELIPPVQFRKSAINDVPFCSTEQLMALLRYRGVTTPYESLLWKLSVRLLDACGTKSSFLKINSGMIALIKGLWSELLSELRIHWDLGIYIPGVDVLEYDNEKNNYTGKVSVDLQHTILHQKLAMINCCLYRRCLVLPTKEARVELQNNAREKKLGSESNSKIHRKTTLNSASTGLQSRIYETISGIADFTMSQSVSSNVLPRHVSNRIAKTYTKGFSFGSPEWPLADCKDAKYSSSKVSANEGTSWSSDKSCKLYFLILGERFLSPSSQDDLKNKARKLSADNSINFMKESCCGTDGIFSVEIEPPKIVGDVPKDMAESFIHHSEAISPSSANQTTINLNSRMGHLKQLGIKMLSSGEPIWEPVTQMQIIMTEDMLQEQEKLFTSLGTSTKGAEIRAKIQSAQLISGIFSY